MTWQHFYIAPYLSEHNNLLFSKSFFPLLQNLKEKGLNLTFVMLLCNRQYRLLISLYEYVDNFQGKQIKNPVTVLEEITVGQALVCDLARLFSDNMAILNYRFGGIFAAFFCVSLKQQCGSTVVSPCTMNHVNQMLFKTTHFIKLCPTVF